MNPRQFFEHAIKMRSAQIRYFRTRDKSIMNESKSLEQAMDAEIVNACLHDAQMHEFVRINAPEFIPAINKAKQEQAMPSHDLFGNPINNV